METNSIEIGENDLQVKEWNEQRVVTFKDIDRVHQRPDGTAGRNFRKNRNHLIENEDYFKVCPDEIRRHNIMYVSERLHQDIVLLTESGYLLIVKSFTDDLAWDVQRKLVNTYFKFKETMENLQPVENGMVLSTGKFEEAVESIVSCADTFKSMIDYSTINYKKQQILLKTARMRVADLLGGAKSPEYKEKSRTYFKNLWQNFCYKFGCGSYKDLNPQYMVGGIAELWILQWEYKEHK